MNGCDTRPFCMCRVSPFAPVFGSFGDVGALGWRLSQGCAARAVPKVGHPHTVWFSRSGDAAPTCSARVEQTIRVQDLAEGT